jgi:hypothetical protein
MLTAQRDPSAEKLLGAPPTSRREFRRDETIAWMVEIYDNGPADRPSRIPVAAQLIAESGQAVHASRDVLSNGTNGAPKWKTFGYTGRIPLKDVATGRYLLQIEADGQVAETLISIR